MGGALHARSRHAAAAVTGLLDFPMLSLTWKSDAKAVIFWLLDRLEMSSRMLTAVVRASARTAAATQSGNNAPTMLEGCSRGFRRAAGSYAGAYARRCLATAALPQQSAGGAPKYRHVPFVREDLAAVMREVPDFKYYYIGNENASSYPYKDVPMDRPILNTVSLRLSARVSAQRRASVSLAPDSHSLA